MKGELLVQPTTNEPGDVFAPGRVVYGTGAPANRDVTIVSSRAFKDGWLVKVDGVDDKTEADRWRGVVFEVPFADLTPPGENEVYLHELVGMQVVDAARADAGTVAGYYEVPQGIILEVRAPSWRADVPFNEAFVDAVERDARLIRVRVPDGLVELNAGPG